MIRAVAKLLCAICSHEWFKTLTFNNWPAVEAHNFTKHKCPECSARASILLPYEGEDSLNRLRDGGAQFDNPIDDNDSADDWKKS